MNISKNEQVEIAQRLKGERNVRMKLKLLAISHFLDGKSRYAIARYLKVSRSSVNRWVCAYLADGVIGLEEKPHCGRPIALNVAQQQQLKNYLDQALKPPHSKPIHGDDIQSYIVDSFGVRYEINSIYRLIKRLGFSLKQRYLHYLC